MISGEPLPCTSHSLDRLATDNTGANFNGPLGFPSTSSKHYDRIDFNQAGSLTDEERTLLNAAAEGNLEDLKTLIHQHLFYCRYVDLNCSDSLDRTALSLAIINGHVEIVKFLLSDDIDGLSLGDSLFYAIQTEAYEVIELLLEKDPQTSLRVQPGTTSPFEPGLTPFKLASHKNNYRILSILYRYSHRLSFSEDELIIDESLDTYSWDAVVDRLLHYRARASPAFLLLMYNEKGMAWDPLNASMDLFGELKQLARREREVEEAYLKMAKTCEAFAVQLLMEVRSSSELADLMRYSLSSDNTVTSSDSETSVTNNKEDNFSNNHANKNLLKPIEKAVQFEMKDFVTADNSQLALIYIQKGKLFRRVKGYKALFTQVLLGCIYPLLTIAFMIAPNSSVGRLLQNPTVKFWCWIMSEIYFVCILIANTILIQYSEGANDHLSYVLVAGGFWILGKLIQEVREIANQNITEYFVDPWNVNDLITIVTYSMYIVLRALHEGSPDHNLRDGGGWDYLQVSDACIAIAYVLVHFRILEILRVERTFGPLQVSLERMARDAISFMVILLIIFLAFSSGLCELFTPYGPGHNCTCNSTLECNASLPLVQIWNITQDASILPACVACRKLTPDEKQTTTLLDSLLGIWWTTFGYGDPRKWYIISNCPETFILQEVVGFFIVAVYHFTVIIVLFNMLIAMMSNSFQLTQDDSVREWKFYRTHLWLKLVSNKITRLPPMNIVPEMKHIKKSLQWFGKLFTKLWRKMCRSGNNSGNGDIYQNDATASSAPNGGSTANHINLTRRRNAQAVISSPEDERYEKVLRLIVLRYVKKKVLRDEMVI